VDAEARLLLYAVAFGAGFSLFSIARRRMLGALRFHAGALAALLTASCVALGIPDLRELLAVPTIIGFAVFALAPSLLILGSRRCARGRHFTLAARGLWTGAALLGLPASLHSESRLYGALAASERGDVESARSRLRALVSEGGLNAAHGGATLADALPLAGARRWGEALAVIDSAPSPATAVLGIEARAAAETGDLRRALRACERLAARGDAGVARQAAWRGVLAAAGRVEFLEDAERGRSALLRGPRGTADLVIGRAHEARGALGPARDRFAAAAHRGRGAVKRDARLGLQRLGEAAPRVLDVDDEELDDLLRVESRSRAEDVAEGPQCRRAIATNLVSALTFVISAAVFLFVGDDAFTLLAAGALSEPLIRVDGEWWRLLSPMFLHGGWLHLILNLSCIVPVGILVERRIGASRTLIVYFGAGLAGSLASVFLNGTQIGVGASGGAMGLIGALMVLLRWRPALFTELERKRWLSTLWVGVIATGAIGLLEAQFIDNAAHGAGLLGGALLALAVAPPRRSRRSLGERQRHARADRLRSAGARLAAALLCGLVAAAGVEAVQGMRLWHGSQEIRAKGARVTVPAWLRVTPRPSGGVVAERPPMEISLFVGSTPDVPLRPTALLDEGTALRAFFDASGVPDEIDERLSVRLRDAAEPADVSQALTVDPDWEVGIQFLVVRNESAYVLVLLPIGSESERVYRAVLEDIRATLAPAD